HVLFRNSIIYIISKLLNSGIPFLLLPILTRYLTPAEYGMVATYEIVFAIMVILVSLNSDRAVVVKYFKLDKAQLKTFIGNTFIIAFGSFLVFFIFTLLTKNILSHYLKIPANWIISIPIISLSFFVIRLTLSLWEMKEKPIQFGIFQTALTVFNLGLSIYLVTVLNITWKGRLLGIIFSYLFFSLLGTYELIRKKVIQIKFDKAHFQSIINFGLPLIPHTLAAWVFFATDRIFINTMIGVDITGIYTVGYQIGALLAILMSAFNQAWVPFVYRKLKDATFKTKSRIVQFTYLGFVLIFLMAVFINYISPWILKIFVDEAFYSANDFVFWILLGSIARGMYFLVVAYIFYTEKTYIMTYVTSFYALLNIILNYFFIKANGAIGAAQATALVLFLNFVTIWIMSMKVYDMPWFTFLGTKGANEQQ
ncbi:MAG: oligosaccharide flippase family protein, partial [Candidatus Omnitrophica bacterium]|nr:oligosaccharide flippase family protein [Candidatus Omnitrophota bacterium]